MISPLQLRRSLAMAAALSLVPILGAAALPLWPSVPSDRAALTSTVPPAGQATGAAAIVVAEDSASAETTALARWLSQKGITAFVLRYRAGDDAVGDVNRAVRVVRTRAGELNVSPQRIAVIGVGRGAELAADAVHNFPAEGKPEATDAVEKESSRPNLLALVGGAKVPAAAPAPVPSFLVGGSNDGDGKSVTTDLWNKLRQARVSVDAHLFPKPGPFAAFAGGQPGPDAWPELFFAWARFQGLLTDAPRVPIKGMVYLDGAPLPHGYIILTPVDFVGAGPIIGRVFNSTANSAIGLFTVPADQGPVAGRYKVDVRQNMNRWLSNSFSGGLVGGRGGNASPEALHFGHHRVLAPSIADQKSFTKVRPTDKDDYIIEIKPAGEANQDLRIEVFSGAPIVALDGPAPENLGGIVGGPKNPGQAAYVDQIRRAGAAPVPGIPEPILLWPNGAPEAVPDASGVFTDEDKPAIYPFPVSGARNTRAAFLVLPGGAFTNRVMDTEGVQIAKFLNQHGIAGFVLRYRLGPVYPRRAISTMDGQRALRYLRANAERFGLAADRIGVIGFSAGAELQGDAFYNAPLDGDPAAADPIDRVSAAANFSALIYGGRNPQKPASAPPTFLFNTIEDGGHLGVQVAVLNALRQANVPVQAHFNQVGPHGSTMSPGDPQLGRWPTLMIEWLARGGFIPATRAQ